MSICNRCGALAIGKDHNSKHQYHEDSKGIGISKNAFRQHDWIVHLQDVLDYPNVLPIVKVKILAEYNPKETPVCRVLQVHLTIRFSFDESLVAGTIYHREDEDNHFLAFMEWDTVLKTPRQGMNPLEVAVRKGLTPQQGADEKYQEHRHKYWLSVFVYQGSAEAFDNRNAQLIICPTCRTYKMIPIGTSKEEMIQHSPCMSYVGWSDKTKKLPIAWN